MAVTIEIDTSELDSLVDGLKKRLIPAQVDRAMSSVLRDTAEHTKEILKRAIPEHYYATPGEVGKAVGKASVTSGGLGVGCCIPITGARKSIGGGFSATGGARGWESLHKRYRVSSGNCSKSDVKCFQSFCMAGPVLYASNHASDCSTAPIISLASSISVLSMLFPPLKA